MGFKKKDYELTNLGLKLSEAYAQISDINCDLEGNCNALFKIQSTRDNMSKEALENVFVSCKINKTLPIYEQVYNQAKLENFIDWEDDIVE
jgi:hypothetical protein